MIKISFNFNNIPEMNAFFSGLNGICTIGFGCLAEKVNVFN